MERHHLLRAIAGCIGVFFVVFCVIAQPLIHAASQDINWLNGEPQLTLAEAAKPVGRSVIPAGLVAKGQQNCVVEPLLIRDLGETKNVCLFQGKYASYGYYFGPYGWMAAVKFANESKAYHLRGVGDYVDRMVLLPGTDTLVGLTRRGSSDRTYELVILKDFTKYLVRSYDTLGRVDHYGVAPSAPFYWLHDASDHLIFMGFGYSNNSHWLVANMYQYGLVRINVDTYDIEQISNKLPYVAWPGKQTNFSFAISNDGRYAAYGGYSGGNAFQLYDVNGCTRRIDITQPVDYINGVKMTDPCQSVELRQPIITKTGDYSSYVRKINFSDDGGELTFEDYHQNTGNVAQGTYDAPGYQARTLDYLALGDSYSSGEGDTEKDNSGQKYYRSHTDVEENMAANQPREKCHVSTRSYPYHLALGMGLDNSEWNTVTCSGAQTYDVSGSNSATYLGQGKGGHGGGTPRLQGYDATFFKKVALNEFIPGRQKQIEFVKKYKPKVITLTIGGNDLGFADKIKQCVTPFTAHQTCEMATNEGKARLGQEIKDQFDKLKDLYQELYRASGNQAKIYVLGYPQFVNGNDNASCAINTGLLNGTERETIAKAVTFFNQVINKAAQSAGVKYVDIENSLGEHRLCDRSDMKYVTGITNIVGGQESFHPNALGHSAIAIAVWNAVDNESLLDYDICPGTDTNTCPDTTITKDSLVTPDYFAIPDTFSKSEYKYVTPSNATRGVLTEISVQPYSFMPGSHVALVVHSDPIDLGDFIVSTDGSLNASVALPASLPVGYHTLFVMGQSYSGEPIEYEQVVLVENNNPDDIDDDGVKDDIDPCLFTRQSGVDKDGDGTDDACDPEINILEEPLPAVKTLRGEADGEEGVDGGGGKQIAFEAVARQGENGGISANNSTHDASRHNESRRVKGDARSYAYRGIVVGICVLILLVWILLKRE